MTDHDNQLVPLSADLELRPARSSPPSLRRLLSPLLEDCVRDITESIGRLRTLAEQASQKEDHRAEAALRAKLIELATKLLSLCRDEPVTTVGNQPRTQLKSQADLPDLDSFPPAAQEKIIEGIAIAERARGRDCSWLYEKNDTPF